MRRVLICLSFAVTAVAQQSTLRNYGRLPLVFEPNQGQADRGKSSFCLGRGGGTLCLTEGEVVLVSVHMRLTGSRKPQAVRGLEPTGGITNYFIGNDPTKWQTGIVY